MTVQPNYAAGGAPGGDPFGAPAADPFAPSFEAHQRGGFNGQNGGAGQDQGTVWTSEPEKAAPMKDDRNVTMF